MDTKKSPKANLENKRTLFIQVGLIVALAITLVAFEWKSYDRVLSDLGARTMVDEMEEMVEITRQDQPPPPPAPPPQTTLINIVEDNVNIEDNIIINVDVDQKTQIAAYVAPAVTQEESVEEQEIFIVVEVSPSFPGGEAARIKFLQENIRYPQMARESGIQGTVYVQFVVERDGSVTDVKVLRGIGGGCDEEAVRVIKAMPRWTPGKQRNRPVRVQFTMPIRFTLQ